MHRRGDWTEWTNRHARRLEREFRDGAPLGHLVPVLANPWDWDVVQLAEERVRLAALLEEYLAQRKQLAITKWRND